MGKINSDNKGNSKIAPFSLRVLFSCKGLKRLIPAVTSLSVKEWFSQTGATPYEHAQRRRSLATMLRVIVSAGVALFLVNVYIHAWNIAIALLIMSFFCIAAFWLNSRGLYMQSASLTLAVILCAADYNLYATGGGAGLGHACLPVDYHRGQPLLRKACHTCTNPRIDRVPGRGGVS